MSDGFWGVVTLFFAAYGAISFILHVVFFSAVMFTARKKRPEKTCDSGCPSHTEKFVLPSEEKPINPWFLRL